jgi:hypothetical protein
MAWEGVGTSRATSSSDLRLRFDPITNPRQETMKTLSTMTTVAALCMALTTHAYADVREYAPAKIQIDIPGGWAVGEADGNLTASSPDGSAAIVVALMDAKDAKRGAKALDGEVAALIPDISLGKAARTTVNGLDGYEREGGGTLDGASVDVYILVLKAPNGKIVMVFTLGVAGMDEYVYQLGNAVGSIAPAGGLEMPAAFYKELQDPEAERVVKAVLRAIDTNDSAALAKLVAKDFTHFGKKLKARSVKRKAKKKVAKWLKMPDAPWYWTVHEGPAFTIKRGSGYGQNWAIEFFDESMEDESATKSRWRIYSVTLVDEGAP